MINKIYMFGRSAFSRTLAVPHVMRFTGFFTLLIAAVLNAGCGVGDIEEGVSAEAYDSGPVIRSISPDAGPPGRPVSIFGEGFNTAPDSNTVTFNSEPAAVTAATDTHLVAEVPGTATTGPVEVTEGGQTALGPDFRVIDTGAIQAFIATGGPDEDTDGYTLTLDGSDSRTVAVRDTVLYEDVTVGMHDLELSGVAVNCSVAGDNPRTVSVTAGDTTASTFTVDCSDLLRNQIVFHTDRDGNQEIYRMNLDGTGQTNLTGNSASDFHPAVSPDGSQVAFVSDRDGNDEIYIMNADGSGIRQITFTTALANSQPAWSPAGDRIAFTRFTGAQEFEVFVIDTAGTGETNLTTDPADDGQPDWSPDGSSIVFSSDRDGDFEIYRMNSDGSGVTRLTDNTITDLAPAWSPNGLQIAYQNNSLQSTDLFIMDSDGSNSTAVTMDFSADDLPDWSPDGTQLVYQSDSSGDLEIWRIDTDGSNQTNLTTAGMGDDEHPSWSPVQ